MSDAQPGPYPQYPGDGGMPPAPTRPPLPDTVRYAFYLMLAGAAIQVLGVLGVFTQTGAIRDAVTESLRNDPNVTQDMVDTGVTVFIIFFVVLGLIVTGLWVWMAYANKAGKNWARITGTVFFGFATLGALSTLAGAASGSSAMAGQDTPVNTVLSLVNWLIGLAVVILLWNGRSTPHFKPSADHGYGYQPPGQAPGYPYPPSGPAPGQTAPLPPPPGGDRGDMPPPR